MDDNVDKAVHQTVQPVSLQRASRAPHDYLRKSLTTLNKMNLEVFDPAAVEPIQCRRKIDINRTLNMINKHLFSSIKSKLAKQQISHDKSSFDDFLELKNSTKNINKNKIVLDSRYGVESKTDFFQSSPLINRQEESENGNISLSSLNDKNDKNANISELSDCSVSDESFKRTLANKIAPNKTKSNKSSFTVTKKVNKTKSICTSAVKDVHTNSSQTEYNKKDRRKKSMDANTSRSEGTLSEQSPWCNFSLRKSKNATITMDIKNTRRSHRVSKDNELTRNDSSWCSYTEEGSRSNEFDISGHRLSRKRSCSSASQEDREFTIHNSSSQCSFKEWKNERHCVTEDEYCTVNNDRSWCSFSEKDSKSNCKSVPQTVSMCYKRKKLSVSPEDKKLTINNDSSWCSFTDERSSLSTSLADEKYSSVSKESSWCVAESNPKINDVLENEELTINGSVCSYAEESYSRISEFCDNENYMNSSWCSYTKNKLSKLNLNEGKDHTIIEDSYWDSSLDYSDVGISSSRSSLISSDCSLFDCKQRNSSSSSGVSSFAYNRSCNSSLLDVKNTLKKDSLSPFTNGRHSSLNFNKRKDGSNRSFISNDSGICYDLKESNLRRKLLKRIIYSSFSDIDSIYERIDERIIGRHDDWINSCKRKILLLGDSHTRSLVYGLQHILPGFTIEAICKPSAKSEQVISGMEDSIASLTKDDFLILLCGTNDTWGQCVQSAKNFIYYSIMRIQHTNILLCNLPRNYSVSKDSHVQENILEFNRYLSRIVKDFTNITLVKLHKLKEKLFFTKHGLHFNITGKIKICELISHRLVDFMDKING